MSPHAERVQVAQRSVRAQECRGGGQKVEGGKKTYAGFELSEALVDAAPARRDEIDEDRNIWYAVDGDSGWGSLLADPSWRGRWRPSIHMPRWASRLSLRVTSVRAERVQDVTEADAMAMGERANEVAYSAREAYVDTFCSEYGSGSWDRNDWVWVFGAERIGGRDG